ncbi:hypothetical protein ACFX2H_021824 [Malus domestica]
MAFSSFHCLFFCSLLFHFIVAPSLAKTASFRPKALVLPVVKDSSTLQYLTTFSQRTPFVPIKLTVDLGGCNNNTCALSPGNTITHTTTSSDLGQDTVSLQSTDGSNPGRLVSVPNLLFIYGPIFLLEGLASGVKGMAGLAGAYFQGEPSVEYFINVKSIKVNGKVVALNTSLMAIDNEGYGGMKISTVNLYMVLETSIYNVVVNAFVKEVANKIPKVKAVAPFRACFSSKSIGVTRVGPSVPSIDLVLQSESVYWTMFRANSMVYVSNDVLCLGFMDGGEKPRTSIVIGGHQLEDNLLQFDLATSRLGFSSSLLFSRTTCGNFNFTSNA